jgi:hypothetical protein
VLSLAQTQVSGAEITKLKEALPKLDVFGK